jgi:predicted ATPase/DNA-binding winged helix-turn-helix (wHTH) protein
MDAVAFGAFLLRPTQRLLTEDGKEVRLGGRAFDILVTLIERRGEIVSHEELRERVWGGTSVDEGSLRVQMSALRKVLGESRVGERYIRNEPGRGYCFVGSVTAAEAPDDTPQASVGSHGWTPAPPTRLTRTVGRESFVELVSTQLPVSRFVTIIGAGGVGKTTVAIDVAERLFEGYRHGACFADLASLQSPELVPSALASFLGLGIYSEDPMPGVKAFLRDRHMLLLLDNCEHVIEAAAVFAEEILSVARNVHILATSREPLRASGEWVRRLPPLEQPPAASASSAAVALTFPAIQLFAERARASSSDFELNDQNSETAAELCRRLEGIPLAIELAAARVGELGLRGLAARLGERFSLMMKGRRTALPRHQTLRGTLDWSHELLAADERAVLRRISVFAGGFSSESAVAVGAFGELADDSTRETLANLVSKCLVSVDVSGDDERYRLFDMTRHYAREKLEASNELTSVQRRHAEHLCALFERAEADWERMTTATWKARYGRHVDDVRAAIAWGYAPEGDAAISVRLTALTGPLWIQLALLTEQRGLVDRALASNAARTPPDRMLELRLTAAQGNLLFHTAGPLVDSETDAAFKHCIELAEQLGDEGHRLRALTGCCAVRIMRGSYPEALTFAEKFNASPSGANSPAANRTLAHNLHYLGDLPRARRHLDAALAVVDDVRRIRNTSGVQYDHGVTVHTILARTLWLTGRPDRALEVAREAVEEARAIDHVVSLSLTLATSACPLAFVIGGRAMAQPFLELLRETALRHSMIRWQHWVEAYDVAMTRRDERMGSALEARMSQLADSPIDGPQLENLAILGDAFTDDRLVEHAAAGSGGWCADEMVRARGEMVLRSSGDTATAEALFRQALEHARSAGARAWELRAATSLARLLRDTKREAEAKGLLGEAIAAFSEGRDSVDVTTAIAVMGTLGSGEVSAQADR